MNTQLSRSLLGKTVGVAIAAAGLLVNVPTFAQSTPAPTPAVKPAPAKPKTPGTIVDVASANPSFKTLVAAVKAAGLVETLSGQGPFTVFAPTDAAFAKLPKGTLEKLLKPENKATLVKVLTYHVISGAVDSKSIKSGEVKTVEGASVKVTVRKAGVTVGNAKVIKADVKASNGYIHVIDTVLLPPGLKL
ncbi:fasciclin domain-containing protein [Calothrix sp. PCC 7507]|uniref:fasciclin domain-containing protein n=1 Tax=Calothrix sp. PCC 7507 TaxID=99598 RepID=UPI00029EDE0F|nr:fasciclin domain-containing protein [Calothrix sp. PCC 7507]AFY34991.1 beta-Ig-H3/fasciclin [Calothrix sp. PCC 7507]